VLVGGLLGMYLVLFASMAAQRLARPLEELTYGESWLLDGARRVAHGETLYAAPNNIPLMQFAYTPLYYVVVGELQHIVGDHGYTVGRAVSLTATLVGAAALMWSLGHMTGSRWVALLGAGLFLTQNLTMLLWASLERVDALALAFTLVGLALATAGRSAAAGVAFVLALCTKQTFVVAPVAVAIALWPCRARFTRFVATVGGGVIFGLLVAQGLTDGWFVWHTVTANANPTDLFTFSYLMGSFFQFNGLPVVACLVSFALPTRPGERIWRLYFIGTLLTLPSLAKLGASSNYWLEVTAATSALLALACYHLHAFPSLRLVAPTVVAGSLLLAVPGYQASAIDAANTLADLLQPPTPRYLSLVGDDGPDPYRVDATFIAQIAQEPGDLLTDNSGLAVAAGKPIEFEFQIFQLLEAQGLWNEQPILSAVAARQFSLVALMHPLDGSVQGTRWTPALQAALQANYVPAGSEAGFWLYRPVLAN
jgi:hypothetical protein